MYESPIEIIQKDIVVKQENDIYQAIYEKGFADGKAHVEANIAKQWEAFKNAMGICSKTQRYVTDDEFRNGCDEYVKGTPTDSKETKTENIND